MGKTNPIQEEMKKMPRITIKAGQSFVVEVKKDGIVIAEVVCGVEQISFNAVNNESKCELSVYNPHFKGKQTITKYEF